MSAAATLVVACLQDANTTVLLPSEVLKIFIYQNCHLASVRTVAQSVSAGMSLPWKAESQWQLEMPPQVPQLHAAAAK